LNHKDVKKIVAEFMDENTPTSTALILVAYGLDKKGAKITGPFRLHAIPDVATKTWPDYIIMGDQELTLKKVKDIIDLPKKGGIATVPNATSLQFEPVRDNTTGHIMYVVTVYGATGGSGIGYTNPSPPKPPCDTDCDYAP